jgi:hypothetical protein
MTIILVWIILCGLPAARRCLAIRNRGNKGKKLPFGGSFYF